MEKGDEEKKSKGRTRRTYPSLSLEDERERDGKVSRIRYNDPRRQNIQSEVPFSGAQKTLCLTHPPRSLLETTQAQLHRTDLVFFFSRYFLPHKNKCHHALSLSEDLMAQPTVPIVFRTPLLPFTLLFSLCFELLGQTRYKRDCDTIGYYANRLFVSNAAP